MAARPSLQHRRQEEDPGAEDAVDAEAEAVDQRELARRTSHEPTLPAGAPARQSTVGRRWFTDPRHRGSTQVPFLSMTWYGPLVVRVLCRVGLLGALRPEGAPRHAACKTDNDHCGEFTRPNDSRCEGAPRCRQGFFKIRQRLPQFQHVTRRRTSS